MTFLDFVQGPLWTVAGWVFVLGVLWRIIGILRLPGRKDLSAARESGIGGGIRANIRHFFPAGGFGGRTAYHVVAGYMFHVGLFVLVLFGAPHVAFIADKFGVAWTPLPGWAFVVVSEVAFAGLIMLYLRRLLDPVMRLISDADDHIGSILVFLVMLTGCMALAESFDGLRALHMLTVDLLLLYFPFSRLMHTFMFAFSRSYTGAMYGRRGGAL
ncbi:MAG: nitrate reductase [Gammaproteobacteria bacterium]